MNEPITPTPKPKRARKASTPRAPRVKDPGIAQIEAKFYAEKEAYRNTLASAKLLTTFINKRLTKLTAEGKNKLADELRGVATPPLPLPKDYED